MTATDQTRPTDDQSPSRAPVQGVEAERDDWKRKAEKPLINHRRCEALQEQVARVRALLDRPLIPSALLLAALDGEEL